MNDLQKLLKFDSETQALAQISGRLGWDQETMMASGSAEQRGAEIAAIEGILHARKCDDQVGEWLSNINDESLDEIPKAQLREIKRSFERAKKVPGDLAQKIARTTSVSQGKWATARADNNFSAFVPVLEEVLKLKREEGQALATNADLYDTMLIDYEPGATADKLSKMFGALRPGLVELRGAILEKEPAEKLQGSFDEVTQIKISSLLAETFGYEALATNADLYDTMLIDYEPGATADKLSKMFGALRPGLVELRGAILEKEPAEKLQGSFDEVTQIKISSLLAETFGYDLNRGRIDKAVHPFSSGSGQDVRITTRTNLHDPFNCFYSTIHEVGHGSYEQNIDPKYSLTAIGQGASMGVHESQSRIYENQLGRSRAFTAWLFMQMKKHFGDFGIRDADEFYKTVNSVNKGFIRTEADEVQYNLHVLLRFDLERALVSGDLLVKDLESAWNDRFYQDFGYNVKSASDGCLQDVHWSVGLFGYFPTYSLGNVYAGCLHEMLRKSCPPIRQ